MHVLPRLLTQERYSNIIRPPCRTGVRFESHPTRTWNSKVLLLGWSSKPAIRASYTFRSSLFQTENLWQGIGVGSSCDRLSWPDASHPSESTNAGLNLRQVSGIKWANASKLCVLLVMLLWTYSAREREKATNGFRLVKRLEGPTSCPEQLRKYLRVQEWR